MKTRDQILELLAAHKAELREKFHLKNIGLFGSYARNDQVMTSDIDILVEFEEPIGLQFVALAEYLETLLGTKVHVVSKGAIKPRLLEYVVQDLLYA